VRKILDTILLEVVQKKNNIIELVKDTSQK